MMYENTTVHGSWINVKNITQLSQKHGRRIVLDFTMAMPHSGVYAQDVSVSMILDLPQLIRKQGLREYQIGASVISPSVNILCASMTSDDLTPIVYDRWPNSRLNTSTWPLNHSLPDPSAWRNETSVDNIFGWGERYGRTQRPIFAKVPIRYKYSL